MVSDMYIYGMETAEPRRLCAASGKRCYSRREAGCVLNALKHHQSSDRNREHPCRCYFCGECRSYHLTKKALHDRKAYRYSLQTQFYMEYEAEKKESARCRTGDTRREIWDC